jgi:hypothetical protein
MIIKNRWIVNSNDDNTMASWQGTLQLATNENSDDFIGRIHKLASEEELYRIVKKNTEDNNIDPSLGLTLMDFHRSYQEDGFYDYLTSDGLSFYKECEEQGKLSYYDLDGKIVMKWIGDFYHLYTRLRPDIYPDWNNLTSADSLKTRVPMKINYECSRDGSLSFTITLPSDIWFPRVVGWDDGEEPSYDNSELAALNTPRLNRFLQSARELILSSGGTWKMKTVDHWYAKSKAAYVNATGEKIYPLPSKYKGIEYIPPECQVSEDGISLELDIRPRNYWYVSESSRSNPQWKIQFPKKRFKAYKELWPFIKTILEVGQREEIFRVLADTEEFRQFIHDVNTGVLPTPYLENLHQGDSSRILTERFKISTLPEYAHRLQAVTKISCYKLNGKLTDMYVDKTELEWFSRRYHQGLFPDKSRYGRGYLSSGSCINFFEQLDPEYSPDRCCVDIELCSDIWFPRVEGYVEIGRGYKKGYDNSELANRHTPRLNRFLEAIANQVIKMGGEWSISSDVDPRYRERMTLTGIKLDD